MTSKKNNFFFEYTLTPDHYLMGKLPKLSDIEFKSEEENGKKKLNGFIISTKDSTFNKAEETAMMKARRLTNYISFIQGRHFSYFLKNNWSDVKDGKRSLRVYGVSTGEIIRTIDINLSSTSLSSLLKRDSKFNQQLAHYSRGLKASADSDPITMFKEFYQVFDEKLLETKNEEYKLLRDLINHPKLDNPKIKKIKTKFPKFRFDSRPKKVHLDLTLETNLKILREIATELKHKALIHMQTRNE
ncbi:MAG: hypothetical protein OEQ94_10475 [Nitrosopumilus sp.]|nr:hypothetical protein [Nitrosopumilus sp.]MDH3737426.1 hypothetical protein [Nitrosopumilus sp.]MDH3833446.1 hypothetical protein [Nitrosopumilus sp.]